MKLLGLHSEWTIFKDMWRDLIWGKCLTLALLLFVNLQVGAQLILLHLSVEKGTFSK